MLLREVLAMTQPEMLLVAMNEKKEELFDGTVCQVDNTLAKSPVKEIGVYGDYSNCLQVIIADQITVDSPRGSQATSTTQDGPMPQEKRVVKRFDSPADLPTMLSVYDLADFLECSRHLAYQLTHSVGFPSIKVGGIIQIPKYLFIRWLEDQAGKQTL